MPSVLDPGAPEAGALAAAYASPGGAAGLGSIGAVTTITSFDAFAAQLPESIAVDRFGNMYVSMMLLGEIWKLDPSGSFQEVVATFPVEGFFGVSGLRFDARENLYATNGSSNADVHGV
jgi:DNA-binding beta-propeller fold protein YncE